MKLTLFPDMDTELENESTDDAPDTAKLFRNDDRLMSIFESFNKMLPPASDAARPANSEATIVFFLALLRPPKRLMAAPENAEPVQNLDP